MLPSFFVGRISCAVAETKVGPSGPPDIVVTTQLSELSNSVDYVVVTGKFSHKLHKLRWRGAIAFNADSTAINVTVPIAPVARRS